VTGRVFEVREFCLHDGPGPRTTVFLQGCPLRCTWCQNPEGQAMEGCVARTAEDVAAEIAKTADFLVSSGGGVTFSGGEPLCQADFICEVIDLLSAPSTKHQAPSTKHPAPGTRHPAPGTEHQAPGTEHQAPGTLTFALETSGFAPSKAYRKVIAKLDLVLQDVKFPDLEGYRTWTKIDATPIFENIAWLKTSGVPFVARIPTMPGVNDTPAAKEGIARLLADAPNLERIELLPYNVLAGSKYAKLGRTYSPGFDERQAPDLSTDIFARHGLKAVAM